MKMMNLSMKAFFHWGVVVNGHSAVARAQYAMAQQVVGRQYDRAEKYYRQAVRAAAAIAVAETCCDAHSLASAFSTPGRPPWTKRMNLCG